MWDSSWVGVLGVRRDIPGATKQCWLLSLFLASHQNSMALPLAEHNTHLGHRTQRNQADTDWEAFSCLALYGNKEELGRRKRGGCIGI